MKKTIAMLVAVGLVGVVGTISFGGTPIGRDLNVQVTSVKATAIPRTTKFNVATTVAVRNIGSLSTPTCWLGATASSSNSLSYYPVPAMLPGQTATWVLNDTVLRGNYTARAYVDYYNTVAEVNEGNNSAINAFSVQ